MAYPGGMSGDPSRKIAELERRLAILEKVIQITAAGSVTIKTGAVLKIESGGVMDLRAPRINLN